MRSRHAVVALALALPAGIRAQAIDRSNGAAGAPILQLSTAPRAAALGGALTAASGVTSIFANPAGAATVQHFEAQLAGQALFEGSKAGSMAVGWRVHSVGLALGIRYLDLGSVDEVVCNGCGGRGTATGQSLSANEEAFALVGAVELGRASVGAALNYYSTTLADASGGAASLSAGVRGRVSEKLAVGASVQYVGGDVNVAGFGAPLPRTVRAGAEFQPLGPTHERLHLLLAADYVAVRGAPGRVGGGLEVGLRDPGSGLLAVARLGAASSAGGAFATRPVTLGVGLRLRQVSLDYAYEGSQLLGSQHRLGLTFTAR
ncbi:MAG: hypothetical protein AUG79_03525 [Gemmatimonadetes bacterium 13_1_20CM_4_69_16]|nr:MAG: hypothetical protein AUG79_03525 [Gemmatimonadetes bacterium 13_1_20CM_4_69_16]